MWVFGQDTLLRGGEVLQVALRSSTVYRHKLKSRDMNMGGARFPFSSLLAPDHHGSWVSSRAVMQPLQTLPLPLLASQFLPSDK